MAMLHRALGSALTLLAFFTLPSLTLHAQEKAANDKEKKKIERPSQDAVLAKNTVFLADQSFGKDQASSPRQRRRRRPALDSRSRPGVRR
jgi:hypothetical protein